MRKLILLFCLFSLHKAHAVVREVCTSGCDYSVVQTAINESEPGDIIELRAGQTFSELVRIRWPVYNITIRSSGYRNLPLPGYRINPERDAPYMATMTRPLNWFIFQIGVDEHRIIQNGISTTTYVFQTDIDASFFGTENMGVSATSPITVGELPSPLQNGGKYYMRNVNSGAKTFQLSASSGGAVIPIADVGTSTQPNYYYRPSFTEWNSPKNITFQGIRFYGTEQNALVFIGYSASNYDGSPTNISFKHCVFSGSTTSFTGPANGLLVSGGKDISVVDSWFEHIKNDTGYEAHAVAVSNISGLLIKNTYLAASGINFIAGGGETATRSPDQNIRLIGNYMDKPGYMHYVSTVTSPTASDTCYYDSGSGAYWLNTTISSFTCTTGACFVCNSTGTYSTDTTAVYRATNLGPKNMLEFKGCIDCIAEGNYMKGQPQAPDAGQGWCGGISTIGGVGSPNSGFSSQTYIQNKNVMIRNNHCDRVWAGLYLSNSLYGGTTFFTHPPSSYATYENNIATRMGQWPALRYFFDQDGYLGEYLGIQRFSMRDRSGGKGHIFSNNTFVGNLYQGPQWVDGNPWTNHTRTLEGFSLKNTLMGGKDYTSTTDSAANCTSPTGQMQVHVGTTPYVATNNVAYYQAPFQDFTAGSGCSSSGYAANIDSSSRTVHFVSTASYSTKWNVRLSTWSPYSASNPSAVLLNDDGTDLGADVDKVEQWTIPAENGEPNFKEQLNVKFTIFQTSATVTARNPVPGSCTLNIYNAPARITGNLVSSSTVTTQLGTWTPTGLSSNTRYYYKLDCGARWWVDDFKTAR